MVVSRATSSSRNPAQLVVGSFVLLIAVGTVLLRAPLATDTRVPDNSWLDALFTATSASTVTGLATIEISELSIFGEVVTLGLIQLGGFGIMTIGSVFALVASRRIGLRQRMLASTEIGVVELGDLKNLVRAIAMITIAVEAVIAMVLFVAFATTTDHGIGRAAYEAVFTSISAFNNAGISLSPDSLTEFAASPFVVFPVTFAFVIGGLGFPTLVEFWKRLPSHRRSLHTRIVLATTATLLVVGPVSVLVFEWSNPDTLGDLELWDKIQAAWFQGVTPRTAGFNTVDIGAMREPTLLVITALMFIGAGPASTSGGIKVTTFAVLGVAVWSEIRGQADTNLFDRRLPDGAVRRAMTIALLSVGLVFSLATALDAMSGVGFLESLFESTSAFGTVGLSTGITAALPASGQFLLVLMMLAGRVGPVTFVAALARREDIQRHRYAVEQPLIG